PRQGNAGYGEIMSRLLKLSPRDSRIAAIGLLLLALLLGYFLLLHWWFVAPLRDIAAQGAGQAASSAFLPEDDPNTAAADLMQRVVDAVGAHTEGGSCTVTQKMPVPNPQVTSGEPYRKAAVSINLSCDIEPLVSVLQALEQGTPYLFVDNLNVYRNPVAARQGNGPSLEVQFTLSGYVRPGGAAPAAAASAPAPDDAADEAGATP